MNNIPKNGAAASAEATATDLIRMIEEDQSDQTVDLLRRMPSLALEQGKSKYWNVPVSPLIAAARRRDKQAVAALLQHGADPHARTPWDGTSGSGWSAMDYAVEVPELAKLFLEAGEALDIFTASSLGDANEVRKLLAEDPACVKCGGPDGATPLHFASTAEVAQLLISAGADISAPDGVHHLPPLRWILGEDRRDVARVLVDNGASLDGFDWVKLGDRGGLQRWVDANTSRVTLRLPPDQRIASSGATLLHMAAWEGSCEMVEFLAQRGAQLEAKDDEHGATPLCWATWPGNVGVVDLLLKLGAKRDARNRYDETPSDIARMGECGGLTGHFAGPVESYRQILRLLGEAARNES